MLKLKNKLFLLMIIFFVFMSSCTEKESINLPKQDSKKIIMVNSRSESADAYKALSGEVRSPGNLSKRAVMEIGAEKRSSDKKRNNEPGNTNNTNNNNTNRTDPRLQ
jgi:hypothetical protein